MDTSTTTPHRAAADTPTGRPAASYRLRIGGRMPLSGVAVRFETGCAKLTREFIKQTKAEFDEALAALISYRALDASVQLLSADGEVLRESALVESPDAHGYLVAEITPGAKAASTDAWLVQAAVDFRKKK